MGVKLPADMRRYTVTLKLVTLLKVIGDFKAGALATCKTTKGVSAVVARTVLALSKTLTTFYKRGVKTKELSQIGGKMRFAVCAGVTLKLLAFTTICLFNGRVVEVFAGSVSIITVKGRCLLVVNNFFVMRKTLGICGKTLEKTKSALFPVVADLIYL